jgi:hypothetical protein
MPGGILILDGLTTPQCLAVIARRLDAIRDFEIAWLAAELAGEGMNRSLIDAMLADRREEFAAWRGECLAELRRWLVGCDRRRLH